MSYPTIMAACAPPEYMIPFPALHRETCITAAIVCSVPAVWRALHGAYNIALPRDSTPKAAAICLLHYLNTLAMHAPPHPPTVPINPSLFLVVVMSLARDPVAKKHAPLISALFQYAGQQTRMASIIRHRVVCISGALYYNAAADPRPLQYDASSHLWPLLPTEWIDVF